MNEKRNILKQIQSNHWSWDLGWFSSIDLTSRENFGSLRLISSPGAFEISAGSLLGREGAYFDWLERGFCSFKELDWDLGSVMFLESFCLFFEKGMIFWISLIFFFAISL